VLRISWTTFERAVRFLLGVGLIVYEVLQPEPAQVEVLVVAVALLGLPDAIRFDRWIAKEEPKDQEGGPPKEEVAPRT
jgi:hypothetical protein